MSRLRIVSRPRSDERGADSAWEIRVEGGDKHAPAPAAHPFGTRVEVRDLFFATPARLKFMKTPRSERDQAVDAVKRLAMAYPRIAFTVTGDDDRVLLRLAAEAGLAGDDPRRARLGALLGREFAENSLAIDAGRGDFRLTGRIGLLTLNRGLPRDQYLVVNGRPVRDRLLVGAVRGAYQDVLARDRHPVVALFVPTRPAAEIDVSVRPAKAEIRFRDAASIRGLIVGALRHALDAAGHRASATVADAALAAFRVPGGRPKRRGVDAALRAAGATAETLRDRQCVSRSPAPLPKPPRRRPTTPRRRSAAPAHPTARHLYPRRNTIRHFVLVDQHAAHEADRP